MITKIKELRNAINMTQQELADAVNVTAKTIISIEKGKYKPSIMLAYKISLIFHVSIEELCCLEDNLKEESQNENL